MRDFFILLVIKRKNQPPPILTKAADGLLRLNLTYQIFNRY